ncbi:hypothetical protein F5J12DRAFT_712976 [Pisolithus orientalis]|uniref:uncharacterized protein n=1 Tax=Pisolithus orientalis TaxID=936130 RepID=UPI002224FB48|nr:uncharacterized protein F5J12DRAFT_712976 [Pisolithus orientalis]KAI6032733.1 hypothetical protein F5J12DRAFT_712976 [Pisolithus orientalis]
MAVFDGVHYILSPSLPPHRRHELVSILDLNGATSVGPYTHLIALGGSYSHHDKQHAESANTTLKVVSDKWVDRSIVMGKIQSYAAQLKPYVAHSLLMHADREQYYSPDPAMIFSGIVACATDLPTSDVEVLSAGVTALGGQWRIGLTRDVTHLFALRPGSDKYNTALHFAPHTRMSIVTPHWFDDSVRLGRRLPETPYLWPDPIVLRPGAALTLDEDAINNGDLKRKKPRTSDITGEDFVGEKEKVWGGRKVLLSRSLELSESQRAAVNAGITRSGGVVVKAEGIDDDEAEERAVDTCDVFVTRWRSGRAYFKAARASRLIGTLTWLFNVESSGTLHSPLDSLLWYPVPRGGIPGLAGCEISITNYTGTARDYLKRLISLTGAKFTPSLSMDNKVLIAGFQPSPKTTRALAWSIPVVNHTWLEDCIVEWRALTVGLERYIVFPPGIDFGKVLMGADGGAVLTYDGDLDGVPEVAHVDDNVMDVDEDAPKNTKTGRAKLTNTIKPNSKGKGRAVPHPQSDGGLSRDDDERSAARSKGKFMAKSNVKSSTTSLAPHRRSPVPAAGKPRPKLVRRNQTSSTANLTQSEPDKQSEQRMDKSPLSVRQPKAKDVRSGDEIIQLDSDSEPAPPPGISRASTLTPIKSGMKPKSKSGHSQKLVDREEPSDKDLPTIHNKNKKAADGKATSSRKANTTAHKERSKHAAQPDVADSTKERRLSTLSSSPPPPSAKTMTTPKRSVSVLVPSLPDEYFTPRGSKGASSSKGKLVVADRSPDAAGKKQMASPSRLKGHRSEASVVDEGDGYVSADTFATMSVRGGPRRSAANKATVKLRDAVMPDVIDYEKERKNQKRRRSAGGRSLFSLGEDDVAESRLVKKRKVEGEGAKADTKGKGKKVKPQEEDEEQEVELAVAIPKEKPKLTKGKGGLQKTASSDMNTPETRTIRLITTGVTLSDEVIKGLSKLGARMTTKSTDCTHLVAKGIVRTEKFLCAMSVSPYVLKEEWVNASIQSGKLLPEHDYLLSDTAAEMKWNFKFSEALERSKQKGCGSQLFKQLSFYLTPKVPIDNKLLKAVVSSAGGQIQNATPTVRILKAKANRYVISCPEDVSIWRPLVDEGYKIYSTELILRAVLKQEIEWDNAECIVSGSDS